MQKNWNSAQWAHSKKKAELILDDNILIEMEFSHKAAYVKMGKRKLKIIRDGFWCPRIIISENGSTIAQQKQIGLWGAKSEFVINDIIYSAKTKQGVLFNISYADPARVILGYKLDTLKSKPRVSFTIESFDLPEEHLFILLALGFYTIKNVALEMMSDSFIITAVA